MNKKGEWRLSPAYDVTYSFNPTGMWTSQHQMSINGLRDDFTLTDLIETGRRVGLKKPNAIVEQTTDIVSTWSKYARNAGVPTKQMGAIKKAFRLKF
jgi:serine/threonine-protein kinase HipA